MAVDTSERQTHNLTATTYPLINLPNLSCSHDALAFHDPDVAVDR